MANYNSGKFYNMGASGNGFNYNSAAFIFQINLTEVINLVDKGELVFANFILRETYNWAEKLALEVVHHFKGNLIFETEKVSYASVFEVFDKFGISDKISGLIISHALNDNFNLITALNTASEIFAQENVNLEDIGSLNAMYEMLDKFGAHETAESIALYLLYDGFNMTDKEPRAAISDFYITPSNDGMPNVIMPFGLYIDDNESIIGFMPEAVDTVVTLEGVDGEIVSDTVYKSRLFNILAYTMDGLTISQKEDIKERIAYILNAVKKDTRTITFADRETSFDVKYSGLAETKNFPSFVRFELPLKSANAYGYRQFLSELEGSGLVTNNGDKETGTTHTIVGPCSNPSFTLGSNLIAWTGTVQQDERLVIDMENETCYLIDSNGKRSNASKGFNKKYIKIPIGSTVLQASSNINDCLTTEWREWVLY